MTRKGIAVLILAFCLLLALPSIATARNKDICHRPDAQRTAIGTVEGIILDYCIDGDGGTAAHEMKILNRYGLRYDVRVSIHTGRVVSKRYIGKVSNASKYLGVKVDYAKALTLAQKKVPGSRIAEFELKLKRNKHQHAVYYEVEVLDQQGIRHTVCVDGKKGTILSCHADKVYGIPLISRNEASSIAARHIGGTTLLVELDDVKGKQLHYKVLVVCARGALYEVKIDARTGDLLKCERDY